MTALTTGPSTRPALPRPALLGLAVVVLVLACLASLGLGARHVDTATLLSALTDFDAADGDHAVLASRVPRTVVAVLVGAALGLAGAAMQGVARNPLADPGILGVSAGAALGVVVVIGSIIVATFGLRVVSSLLTEENAR